MILFAWRRTSKICVNFQNNPGTWVLPFYRCHRNVFTASHYIIPKVSWSVKNSSNYCYVKKKIALPKFFCRICLPTHSRNLAGYCRCTPNLQLQVLQLETHDRIFLNHGLFFHRAHCSLHWFHEILVKTEMNNLIGQASNLMTNQIYRNLFWFDRTQSGSAQLTPAQRPSQCRLAVCEWKRQKSVEVKISRKKVKFARKWRLETISCVSAAL